MPDMAAFEADYRGPLNLATLKAGKADDELVRYARRILHTDAYIAELDRVRADYERARTALLGY